MKTKLDIPEQIALLKVQCADLQIAYAKRAAQLPPEQSPMDQQQRHALVRFATVVTLLVLVLLARSC